MSDGLQQVINYMIPAVGTPRGYFWTGDIDTTPVTIDFRNVSGGGIDGQPFRPSGVFIDNTRGTAPLTIVVNEISYQMICLEGELLNLQFPAPVDVSVTFTGFGEVTLAFVDFPVLPYRNLASVNQNILWGNISGTLSDQTDLQNALDAKMGYPAGGLVGDFLQKDGASSASWAPATITFQEEGADVVASAKMNVVGDAATITDVAGVATLTIEAAGTDFAARAGATRFVVPGTFTDPSATGSSVNRDALRVNAANSGAEAFNATISGLNAIDEMSGFIQVNFATLPPSNSTDILYVENTSTIDLIMKVAVNTDGSVSVSTDQFGTMSNSAAGVIVAGTTHSVVVMSDFSAAGQPIRVFVDGVEVITTVAGANIVATESEMTYRVGSSVAIADGVYSRMALWSGLLLDAEAIEISNSGDPQGTAPATAVLRAYWLLDEGTGTTAAATVGGANMTLFGSGAGWGTMTVVTPLSVGSVVRVASAGATGAFATHENDLAIKTDAGWDFLVPVEGWNVYDQTTGIESQWGGAAWAIYDQEGTFVPTLGFQTPGDQNIVYNFNTGSYQIKNGWAHIHFDISATVTHTTASGDFQISGAPVTPGAGNVGVGALVMQGITNATFTNFVALSIPSNPTVISGSASGQNTAFMQAAHVPSGGTVLLRATLSFPL